MFSRLDEQYLSKYVSPFLFLHSVIGDLKPVSYYTASQAWSFGGRHMYARRSQRRHPVCSRYTFLVNIALYHNRMLLSLLSRVIKCTSQRYHFYRLWREERLYVPNASVSATLSDQNPIQIPFSKRYFVPQQILWMKIEPSGFEISASVGTPPTFVLFWTAARCCWNHVGKKVSGCRQPCPPLLTQCVQLNYCVAK